MKNLIFILLVFISVSLFGQRWEYSTGGNAFDGKYKTSSVIGTGTKSPYRTPMMVVNLFDDNDRPSVYFANAGYAGCGGKRIYINFDDNDEVYSFYVNTNNDKDVWFIEWDYSGNDLEIIELLEKLKKHSYVNVRIKSDCGKNDLKFTLSGSSVAIDFVTKKWVAEEKERKQLEEEQEQLAIIEMEKQKRERDSIKKVEQYKRDSINAEVNKILEGMQQQENLEIDSVLKTVNSKGYYMMKDFNSKDYKLKQTILSNNKLYKNHTDMNPAKTIPNNTLLVVSNFNSNYFKVVNIENEGNVEYYISSRNVIDALGQYQSLIEDIKKRNNDIKASKLKEAFPSDNYKLMVTSNSTNMYLKYTSIDADLVVEKNVICVIAKYEGKNNYYKVVYVDNIGQVDLYAPKMYLNPL